MTPLPKSPPLSQLTGHQVHWIGAGYLMTLGSLPGQTIFIAQFNSALRDVFSLSHGEFGGLYTLGTLASSIALIWAGSVVDKVGPRILGPACLIALALISVGMVHVASVFALGLVIFGLRFFGQGMMGLIAMTAMTRWFHRFRGRALAISQLGVTSGDAVLPLVITLGIAAIGWRQVWLVAATVLILILVPLIAYLLRDPPDGKRALARGAVNPDADVSAKPTGEKWTRSETVKDPIFWLILPGFMAPWAIGTLFIFHQAHLSAIKGWEITTFTAFFPVLSLSVVLASLGTGALVDKYGAWRILPFYLVPLGLGCIVLGTLNPVWAIPFYFMLFGATMGMSGPIIGALLAELYGTAHVGAVRALATSVLVLASAVGPGVAGWLIDMGFDLDRQAFVYATYCFGIALTFYLLRGQLETRVREILSD